jgi:DNA invertase Pin-like site-specific DNA recombinase
MTRAVLYLRLSLIVEDSTSIARQEADLRALCEREGWTVARLLVDDGRTGRKARANADEALRMIRDREADVLLTWKLDRWTRQGLSAIGALVDTLDATPGALFVAMQDGLRSDQPAWRLIAAVLSEVARTEAENIATRTKNAIGYRKTVAHRFTGGGTIPFGYASVPAPDGVGRVLVVEPAEAAIVREVAERLLEQTESLTAIAADLTARGIPTSKSPYRKARYRGEPDDALDRGRWTVTTVKALWTADTLLGRVSLGPDVVRDDDGLPVAPWPPILDLATMERLRRRIGTRDPAKARRGRASRLLSGVAYCAHCDGKLYVTTSSGKPVYRCKASWNGDTSHPSPLVDAENLEAFVSGRFLAMRGNDPELDLVEDVTEPGTVEALAEVEAALRETTAALMEDTADSVALVRRLDALKDRRAQLRALPATTTTRLVPTGRTLAEAWDAETDIARRRETLLVGLDSVTVAKAARKQGFDAGRVTFNWVS